MARPNEPDLPLDDEDDASFCYASPPCFMHEVDPVYVGLSPPARHRSDVARWRKAKREELIAARMAIDPDLRTRHSAGIATQLDAAIGDFAGRVISLYWPFRAEPDLRSWMELAVDRGAACALPVVVAKGRPLIFRRWMPGCRLERGVWNIPVPADGAELSPDVVIAPVVGFDRKSYRLGYGGGFFDRTLAALASGWKAIGVGYSSAELPTIYPQPHDIPMHMIITESEIVGSLA